MRILFLETPTGYGGSMQSLLELIEYLPDEIDPVVAVPYDVRQYRTVPEKIRWEIIDAPKPRGFHGYVRLFTHQLGWYGIVRRLLREHRPQLVHLNSGFLECLGGAVAARRARLSVVAHARGFSTSRRLLKRTARLVDCFVAISRAVAQNLVEHGVHPAKCKVVYDPVVAPRDPPTFRIRTNVAEVGILGMLQPWKGQHVFVEALHRLYQQRIPFHASIAGAEPFGKVGYERRLREMVRSMGMTHIVEFLGFVSKPFEYLKRLDVAVHASLEPEPLGRVVVEAMLAGAAVVATSGGGVPEVVCHERTGLLVPMGNAQAMAGAIQRLLQDVDLRRRLADAGAERAREMFDPVKHAREIMTIYHESWR